MEKAIKAATEIINSFENKYEEKWLDMMRDKLGLSGKDEKDKFLFIDLLTWMHDKKMDYTNTFCHLMEDEIQKNKNYEDKDFKNWKLRWNERLKTNNNSPEKYLKLMKSVNPLVIPRNHKVEEALNAANLNDLKPFLKLLEILDNPYKKNKDAIEYQIPSAAKEKYQTFCGT